VKLITAHSPEAKGRIERLFGTLQDRLVKEMRLLGISTPEEGDVYLRDVFIPRFNKQFGVVSTHSGDVHRPLLISEKENILAIFSIQNTRVVSNDFCIRFENKWIQLEKIQPLTVCRKDTVVIENRIDGTLHVKLREKYLNFKLLLERPLKQTEKITALVPASIIRVSMQRKVQENHPWRSQFFRKTKIANTKYNAIH
jgi:hypothetical protein